MLIGFLNFHVEGIIRRKILFNLLWRQLNQHTCDLWCFFWSYHSNNVVENTLTNLVFQIWVLFSYSWNNFLCMYEISLLNTHLLHVLRWNHRHSVWSHWLHLGNWLWNHSWLWGLWHSLLVIHTMSLILMMLNLILLHLVVLVVLIVVSILVMRSSSSMSLVVSISLVHLSMS